MKIPATYRTIFFQAVKKYIAVAYNYKEAVLISTEPCNNLTEARNALDIICNERNVELRYFDNEYYLGTDEMLYPMAG